MSLRQKLNSRIFKGFCLLLFLSAGLIGYSMLESARQNQSSIALPDAAREELSEENEEQSKREPGLRFRRLQLQDEKGSIDPDGLRKAKEHIEKMKRAQKPKSSAEQANQLLEAGIAPDSWSWLGPEKIGGRIRSIVIQPNNANNMWVGSVSGGIWRTTNAGASWFPVNDFMANLAISTMVINPANANILYAGTGEGFTNLDSIQGAGVFRSTDGGTSWNQLESTNNSTFNFVNRLAVSPNGATLLAANNTGISRSTDSGATWTLGLVGRQILDADFQPDDSSRVIAGGLGGAFFSVDGGQNWASATFAPAISNGGTLATNGRVELSYAPSSTSVVYAGVNRNNGEIYRSTDGGQTYNRVSTGINYMGNQGWYDNSVWVNPQNSNFIVVGGIHLWRSTDGGANLTQISSGGVNSPHADHHIMVSHPAFDNNTNRTVYSGNDGGIHLTNNIATATTSSGWGELNNNLGITQFYGAAGNPTSGVIIGGTQDNGTLRYTGGTKNWTSTALGDGGYSAADPTNANFFYGEFQNLGVFRSSDDGRTAALINAGILDAPPNCSQTTPPLCQTNFIAPLALDNSEPTRLLAGGWSLWRTNDARGAAQWNSIKAPTGGNSPISAIAISPNNSDFIVVGHNNGDIFLTFNGTSAAPIWSKIDTAGLPDRFVTRLTIDNARSPNWIYATFGGFRTDNVYVNRNLGGTWTDITGTGATGLPDVPVRSLVFHPFNRNLLYVGTEVGIFTSEDAGATWDLPNGGPANVSVDELFWMGGDLIAATHGRGLYRASGGIYVDCNFTGIQRGTFNEPFRTVQAAINAVTLYRPIWLKPCNYNEQINTANYPTKRFEIRSLGGSATIGTP